MKDITYLQHAKILKEETYNTKLTELENNGLVWPYLLVSSNLATFLPQLKDDDYKIIQGMNFHRSLSGIELLYPSLLEKTKIYDKSNVIKHSAKQGYIFVSYHIGSYNLPLRHLVNNSIPFCVVASKDYLIENEGIIQKLYKDVPNKNVKKLEMYSADNPRLLLELTKKLKEGISVYIFIDGNSGAKKNELSKDKNLLKINFLSHHIYARQGVAFLAYLSKSPIATVIAKRDSKLNNTIYINLLKTNDLIQKYNRNDFINLITQKLYRKLEKYLLTNFEQWSGWFYLHNFFDTKVLLKKSSLKKEKINFKVTKIKLNPNYHLVSHGDKSNYLVMKENYQIIKIKKHLFNVLTYFKSARRIIYKKTVTIDKQYVSWDFVNELIEMNFLKPIL